MKLSLLIPTINGREHSFNDLLTSLNTQIGQSEEIEIISFKDNKELAIGDKRNQLYQQASGLYSLMIDDDDLLSGVAIDLIMEAVKEDSDCIGYREVVNIDNRVSKSNISLKYDQWEGDGGKLLSDGFMYHRTPFFKTPIKTEICRSVGVSSMRFGEDHDFARRIKPLLKTETYIDRFIYYYIHKSSPHNLRYGINK